MGKTYRHQAEFDDNRGNRKGARHRGHSNNKKLGGMRIVNEYDDQDLDDLLEDDVSVEDRLVINKTSE